MIRPEELQRVSGLEPIKRYKYFIRKIADLEELWVLSNDNGDIALSKAIGKTLVPLWSSKEYVESCRNEEWESYTPTKISLEILEDKIFPMIRDHEMLVNVFPVKNKSGFVVSYEELVRDLNEELENYK